MYLQQLWIYCNSKRFTKINRMNLQYSAIRWQHGRIKLGCNMIWSCGLIFIQPKAIVCYVIEIKIKWSFNSPYDLIHNVILQCGIINIIMCTYCTILFLLVQVYMVLFCHQMTLFCDTNKNHCCDHYKRNGLCSLYEKDTCEFCVVCCG